MKRLKRIAILCSASFAVLLALAYISLFVWNDMQVRRAQKAWRSFESIRVGTHVPEHGVPNSWCEPMTEGQSCYFAVSIWPLRNAQSWQNWAWYHADELRKVGIHVWGVEATIVVNNNGEVTQRNGTVQTWGGSVTVFSHLGLPSAAGCDAGLLRHPAYRIARIQKGPTLLVEIADSAPPEQQEHAWDIRFGCLKEFSGCTLPQLAPSIWKDDITDKQWWSADPHREGLACKSLGKALTEMH